MRLVIKYEAGDVYTWWCNVVVPIEYESAEQLYVDFETLARYAHEKDWRDGKNFNLGKHTFESGYFFLEDGTYTPPEILTIDEWFALP